MPNYYIEVGDVMNSIVVLSISGYIFFLETNGITQEQVNEMQELANNYYNGSPRIKSLKESEICDLFLSEVFDNLGIALKPLQIFSVVRINI